MGIKPVNHVGTRFGRLVVLSEAAPRITGPVGKRKWQRRVRCLCDCGNESVHRLYMLKAGKTKSCGCFHRELIYRHGGKGTPEYSSWKHLKQRCLNPKDNSYKRYGGRGIKVHAAWINDFAAFLAHVGKRPSENHSLDRIDPNGNYEPGNVRWATPLEQRANQRPRCPTCGQARPGLGQC